MLVSSIRVICLFFGCLCCLWVSASEVVPIPDAAANEKCAWMSFIRAPAPYAQCLRRRPDHTSDAIRKTGASAECDTLLALWQKELETVSAEDAPNVVFVDAGASIGVCTLHMLAHGIKTVAFEPFRSNLFYLTASVNKNAHLQHLLTLHPYVALSNESSSKPVLWHEQQHHAPEQPKAATAARPGRGRPGRAPPPPPPPPPPPTNAPVAATTFEVTQKRLDDVLSPPPRILLLKVGFYDPRLFAGARRLFEARAVRTIAFEIGHNHILRNGPSAAALLSTLHGYGYNVTNARGEPMTPLLWDTFLKSARVGDNAPSRYDFIARLHIPLDSIEDAVWS